MTRKSSADYQREYRKRLREQGLIKKEVWILPEHASALAAMERRLRQPAGLTGTTTREMTMSTNSNPMWVTSSLCDALKSAELFSGSDASIEHMDGANPSLHITMHGYGDLPIFLAVTGEQIIVEAILWSSSTVTDVDKFNDEVLRTHKLFPLSTVSLETMPDGESYYTMFGALSAYAALSDVVFEIEMLADNVISATEAYAGYLADTAA